MFILYIDPGTGSMLISAMIAMISVAFFMIKGLVYRKFGIGGDKGEMIDLEKTYELVFYSEGKQYWTVFKSLVEECSELGINVNYFTSDKEDPGLELELPNVNSIYIGSGREAFFVMNRIKSDVVIMTTPGLDVLELKRSSGVKHYIHISHTTGSVSGYKAFALDYFDSVIIGGEGDVNVIRELEQLRNLPKKKIEVVGHTYLDELRTKVENLPDGYTFFEESRETILISPTWGNHGLLTNYGEHILSTLVSADKYNIIVRPHPQSFVSEPELMDKLMKDYPDSKHLVWDRHADNIYAMAQADVMLSDFSGIIFDFFTLFRKPLVTMTANYDKRGRDAMDLKDELWNVKFINKIGVAMDENSILNIGEIVEDVLSKEEEFSSENLDISIMDKYPKESRKRGSQFISEILQSIKDEVADLPVVEDSSYEIVDKPKRSFAEDIKAMTVDQNMIFQITLSIMMLFMISFAGSKIFPKEGLNQLYFTRLMPYALVLGMLSFIYLLVIVWIKDKGQFKIKKNKEKIDYNNLYLIVLPLTPIVQYVMLNQDILGFFDTIYVVIFFAVLFGMLLVVVPWILSPILNGWLSVSVLVSVMFVSVNMASFGRTTRILVISLILAAIILAVYFSLRHGKSKVILIVMILFFVSNSVTTIVKKNGEVVVEDNDDIGKYEESIMKKATHGLQAKRTPDVFLMVYDAYANEETWGYYDYDNSNQMDYLQDKGFTIYDGTYSVGASSLVSMTQVLHPEKTPYHHGIYRDLVGGEASTLEMFRDNGYNTKGIFASDYMTKGADTSRYDAMHPDERYAIKPRNIIIQAVFEGEFRFDAEFSTFKYVDYLAEKELHLSTKEETPTFMYFHDRYPGHTQNSGKLLPGEREMIIDNLETANAEMRVNIEDLDLSNRDAIIIIMGDHGPYLTKNGTALNGVDKDTIDKVDVQDRFGAFLAIKWPDESYQDRYDIQIIQDALPAVIAYMYDNDNLYEEIRMSRKLIDPSVIGGLTIDDGQIKGGIDDGKPLFEDVRIRFSK